MRRWLAHLLIFLISVTAAEAGTVRSRLLSVHAALVAPGTAPEVMTHLSETWDALICIPGGHTGGTPTNGWPIVDLPELPTDPKTATDSLASWRDRFGFSVVFAPESIGQDGWATAASVEGLALYVRVSEFQKGDFALPVGTGYEIYRGPEGPLFSSRISRLQMLRLDQVSRSVSRGTAELIRLGDGIEAAFKAPDPADPSAADVLLSAVHIADSIGKTSDSVAALSGLYSRRWAQYLGAMLTPEIERSDLELFSGVARAGTVAFKSSAAVPVNLLRVTVNPPSTVAEWGVEFPHAVPPGGRAALPVRLTAGPPTPGGIRIDCRFEYRGFVFERRLALPVSLLEPLELDFEPPILFDAGGAGRAGGAERPVELEGRLRLRNRSSAALSFQLAWSAEDPIDITAPGTDLRLAADEARVLTFRLSVPGDLDAGDYGFGVRVTHPSGIGQTAEGSLWSPPAFIDRGQRVGVVGGTGPWLRALKALGIAGYPLVASALGQTDLSELNAIVIPADVETPDVAARAALQDFAESGHAVLVELDPTAVRWLPWDVRLTRRPGPYAAMFYDENLAWWESPNRLVGGCFAAAGNDPVYTLPTGSAGWESLLIDEAGKAYMYRRPQGRGWYVAVHTGWAPRFDRLDRRALLGLVSLVGTKRN